MQSVSLANGPKGRSNRIVANPPDAAAIEVTFGGLAVRAGDDLRAPLLIALTGAAAPATVDGRPVGHHSLVRLRAGQTLRHLDWFEVTEIRGQVENGEVAHFQVGIKVGFRLEDA